MNLQFLGSGDAVGRTAPLTIADPPGLRDRLTTAMATFFAGSTKAERRFASEIRELESRAAHDVEGIEVTPFVIKQPLRHRPSRSA